MKLSLSKIALVSQYYEKSISLANEAIALAKSAKITPGVKVDGGSQVPTQVTQTDFTGAIALSAVLVFIAIAFVSYYILIKISLRSNPILLLLKNWLHQKKLLRKLI